jgi:peptidoglycan/xylan/chitin deacetylase (PgdA/CDA1 family)
MSDTPYSADRSLFGKLRRRIARAVTTKPARLENLRRPLLTVSFDDAPVSAAENGAGVLGKYGAKGTYFISADLCGKESHLGRYTTADDIQALAALGHEIACHTFTHLDCGRAGNADIEADIARNQAALQEMGLPASQTFAYPYGDVSPAGKKVLNERYLAARALHHGLITTGGDLNQAPAVGIEGPCGEQTAYDWMLKAAKTPSSWLVLYTHDVRETPSDWGCTPEVLDRILAKAREMRFDIVTFAEGARMAQGSERADAA